MAALAARGYSTFHEPGRMVVDAQLASDGQGLPWKDVALFAELVIEAGVGQWQAATLGLNFYDRSLIDAVTWYERQPQPVPNNVAGLVQDFPYDNLVFLTPPWPGIYVQDAARRHTLLDAIAEYDALCDSYPAKGYDIRIVPKGPVRARVDWILGQLNI